MKRSREAAVRTPSQSAISAAIDRIYTQLMSPTDQTKTEERRTEVEYEKELVREKRQKNRVYREQRHPPRTPVNLAGS